MKSSVIDVDPRTDARWDDFVRAHPDALVYHRSVWLQVIERAYGHEPRCLACEGSDGSFHGILPLFHTHGLLTGRRFSSLPHTPVGGPLTRDDDAARALLQGARERVDREPGSWLQLKVPCAWRHGLADDLVGLPGQATYVLELPRRVEELRFGTSRNHSRIQWSVRKAARQHVTVRYAQSELDLEAWYGLYLETMRWHAVPPRPIRFFKAAWEILRPAGLMSLLLAEKHAAGSARLVAGSIFFMSGKTVFYAFNGSRRQDLGLSANDAIQWQAIHDACREGYRHYDLGEVDDDNQGLAEFKSKWGARAIRLHRYYYPLPNRLEARTLAATTRGAGMLGAVWRRLPLQVTAVLGDGFYRGV
jgi:CelD/BcsL family acetyltransferase involved in cellulose biosynthesis